MIGETSRAGLVHRTVVGASSRATGRPSTTNNCLAPLVRGRRGSPDSLVAVVAARGRLAMPVDGDALRVELARRDLTQTQLALLMKLPPTTLSTWIRGAHPAPSDLAGRIEKALGLAAGVLDAADGDRP